MTEHNLKIEEACYSVLKELRGYELKTLKLFNIELEHLENLLHLRTMEFDIAFGGKDIKRKFPRFTRKAQARSWLKRTQELLDNHIKEA